MRSLILVTTLLTLASLETAARGERINLDFGPIGAGPSDAYPAAGMAGAWNVVDSIGTSGISGLFDVKCHRTGLSIASSDNLFAVTPSAQPFSGEDAELLGDYLVSAPNNLTLTFTGLAIGSYRIITYTVGRQDFPRASTVTPFGNPLLTSYLE